MAALCGKCHSDTVENMQRLAEKDKQEKAAAKGRQPRGELVHKPVQDGECLKCHSVHSSDSVLLMKQPSIIELCGTCHDWQKHTSHPMGEKYADTRNRNLMIDCLSCHRSHGTGYRYLMPFPTTTETCVQCHKEKRR
jgi:predicted CXXCH cytochrome family protein